MLWFKLAELLHVGSLTVVGFAPEGGGGAKEEAAEGTGVLTLLLLLPADDGEMCDGAGSMLRPLGGGGKSGWDADGAFKHSISVANFSSVALRSAIKSAMSASKSLPSSSWRDSGEAETFCQEVTQ